MTDSGAPAATRLILPTRPAWLVVIAAAMTLGPVVASAQKAFREFPSYERSWQRRAAPATEAATPHEFTVGRLMFPQAERGWALGTGRGDWRRGGTAWAVDYPQGDRAFARLLGRVTQIDVRAVEQPVNLEDDLDPYYWPFLISGLVGAWNLSDAQAAKLRDYLLRGGFLLCDSFFGSYEWDGFIATLNRVFPDRPVVELPDDHPIFHAVYDLGDRRQIPTWQHLPAGYRGDGAEPRWRAVLDDDERVMVMIAFNNDIADGWQRADEPDYPQEEANLAIRLGVNFAVYALTH